MCVLFQMVVRMFAVYRWEQDDVKNTFLHLHGPSWSCSCNMSLHPKCSAHKSSNKTWHKIWNRAYIHKMGQVSSVSIATRYGQGGPGIESQWGARFSASVQTGPGAYPASYTMGTGSFLGVNRLGHGVDHRPHLALSLKKELYLYSPPGPSWPVPGWTLPLLYHTNTQGMLRHNTSVISCDDESPTTIAA